MKKLFIGLILLVSIQSFAKSSGKVLVMMSAADVLTLKDGKQYPTGFFLQELTTPLMELARRGIEFEFTSPEGLAPRLDTDSLRTIYWLKDWSRRKHKRFYQTLVNSNHPLQKNSLLSPIPFSSLTESDLTEYSAILVPGGHAPMVDLAYDKEAARILKYFIKSNKPTGLICHGLAALLSLQDEKGINLKGQRATSFSTLGDKIANKLFFRGGGVPYFLDQELRKMGMSISTQLPFRSHTVCDKNLVTGQNPYSAKEFSKLFARKTDAFIKGDKYLCN